MEFTGRGRVEADTGLSENKCYSVTLALKVKELAFLSVTPSVTVTLRCVTNSASLTNLSLENSTSLFWRLSSPLNGPIVKGELDSTG